MTIPTISLISPNFGRPLGGTLIAINGSGFRLPLSPPTNFSPGTNQDFIRTVGVTIGGKAAADVRVLKPSLLTCRAPMLDPGQADVVVTNLDDDGSAITGETVTAALAYTARRRRFDIAASSDLTRLVAELIMMFRRELLDNVVNTTSTDFDESTGDMTEFIDVAKLPQIVLIGPELSENRFYSDNELTVDDSLDPILKIRREAKTHDVSFDIVGATDNEREMINMMSAVEGLFHMTKFVEIPKKEGSSETVRFELDLASNGNMKSITRPNRDNLRAFRGAFLVRGFKTDDPADFPGDLAVSEGAPIDSIILETTRDVGQS